MAEVKTIVWEEANKKHMLRVKYKLNENSIIFDVGAYKGEFALKMHKMYNCNVYCFEPVEALYNELIKIKNSKIKTFSYAIGGNSREDIIYLNKDGSSIFVKKQQKQKIKVHSILDVINDLNISNSNEIKMLKLNIEGAEYEIMECLINNNILDIFDIYQIQFHKIGKDFLKRREVIRDKLKHTHKEDYNYEFIWESWSKKK